MLRQDRYRNTGIATPARGHPLASICYPRIVNPLCSLPQQVLCHCCTGAKDPAPDILHPLSLSIYLCVYHSSAVYYQQRLSRVNRGFFCKHTMKSKLYSQLLPYLSHLVYIIFNNLYKKLTVENCPPTNMLTTKRKYYLFISNIKQYYVKATGNYLLRIIINM